MGIAFRPMTPEEIAARDQVREAQKKRLGGPDGIGYMYWLGRALGWGIPADVARGMWDRGVVLADMEQITDAAVEESLR